MGWWGFRLCQGAFISQPHSPVSWFHSQVGYLYSLAKRAIGSFQICLSRHQQITEGCFSFLVIPPKLSDSRRGMSLTCVHILKIEGGTSQLTVPLFLRFGKVLGVQLFKCQNCLNTTEKVGSYLGIVFSLSSVVSSFFFSLISLPFCISICFILSLFSTSPSLPSLTSLGLECCTCYWSY